MNKKPDGDYKAMYRELGRDLLINLSLFFALTVSVSYTLRYVFSVDFTDSSVSLYLGILGVFLAFIGNMMVSDAVKRYGSSGLPQWKYGNRLQGLGFALTIAALLIK